MAIESYFEYIDLECQRNIFMKSLFKANFDREEVLKIIKSDSFQFLALFKRSVKAKTSNSFIISRAETILRITTPSISKYKETFLRKLKSKKNPRNTGLTSPPPSQNFSLQLSQRQIITLNIALIIEKVSFLKKVLSHANKKLIAFNYEMSSLDFKGSSSEHKTYEEIKKEIIYYNKENLKESYVCAFAHYNKHGNFDQIIPYLTELRKEGFSIAICTTSPIIDHHHIEKIKDFCFMVIKRENIGLDFGSWNCILREFSSRSIKVSKLLMVNDSVIGPFDNLGPTLDLAKKNTNSIVGLTSSKEVLPHLQSYFLLFNQSVTSSLHFKKFVKNFKYFTCKKKIIWEYEINLQKHFNDFSIGAIIDIDSLTNYSLQTHHPFRLPISLSIPHNPCIFEWDSLVTGFDFPFLKKELIRDDPMWTLRFNNPWKIIGKLNQSNSKLLDNYIQESSPSVAVVLTTFQPNIEYLKKQIQSIKNQDYPFFKCFIHDDNSGDKSVLEIKKLLKETSDSRFFLHPHKKRLRSYENFERGLATLDKDQFEYIALADQDDVWTRNKLSTLVQNFKVKKTAAMMHHDAFLINETDEKINDSLWALEKRSLRINNFFDLILKNEVTGCTSMFKSSVLSLALPFPKQHQISFHHDLWLAICSKVCGDVLPVNDKLIGYRQHSANVIGVQPFFLKIKKDLATNLLKEKLGLFKTQCYLYKSTTQILPNHKPTSLTLMTINKNLIKNLLSPSTKILYVIYMYIGYFLNLLSNLKSFGNHMRTLKKTLRSLKKVIQDYEPLQNYKVEDFSSFKISKSQSRSHYILLLPSAKPESIYGGIYTALSLVSSLTKVKLTDITISSTLPISEFNKQQTKDIIEKEFNLSPEQTQLIKVINESELGKGNVKESSVFISTFWHTALTAHSILKHPDYSRETFYYLIQDYEPGFYSWSSEYALALESYTNEGYIPIFNSSLLRDYFYTEHPNLEASKSYCLKPQADLKPFRPKLLHLEQRDATKIRVFIYGRPNTPRNLFEIVISGINHWAKNKNFKNGPSYEFCSAGENHTDIHINKYVKIKSLGKMPLEDYRSQLKTYDIGISLMLSPHPSYPPLEMASAGLIAITNKFKNKDLREISKNILSINPTKEDLAKALELATVLQESYKDRLKNSNFNVNDMGSSIEEIALSIHNEKTLPSAVTKLTNDINPQHQNSTNPILF
jgi:O-antigen biosynthesis protein